MKRIKCLLLACVLLLSLLTWTASCAVPETVQPLWNNTYDVVLSHLAVGTTAYCTVDITPASGSTIMNAKVWLIAMDENPQEIVQRWNDPEMTVDAVGTYSFYGTVPNIVPGNGYRLCFQCEVWRNGVCDEISLYKDSQY